MRKADLDAALEAAWDRIDDPKAKRLQFRAAVFTAMASAVESEFKTIASESGFPDDAVILFAEALAENGIDALDEIEPCAIRFNREDLGEADYERAG